MSADRGTALSQNDATDPLGHQRPPKFSSRDVFKVSRLGRYKLRILIVGVGMVRREFKPWPAGGQFRGMEPFCLTADTSLRLICAEPIGQR